MTTTPTPTSLAFDKIMSSSVFHHNGPDIDLCEALIELCDAINAEEETNWYLGECADCCLDDLLIGAYWSLTEWHAGQWSIEYRALCAIGSIFKPGMSGPPTEEDGGGERIAYEMVGEYFERRNKA
jgi:hypothetical protein